MPACSSTSAVARPVSTSVSVVRVQYERPVVIRQRAVEIAVQLPDAGAVIEHGGQILLVENRRADGRVDWSMPGGVVEEGEDPLLGLHREVSEETGLSVAQWGPLLTSG